MTNQITVTVAGTSRVDLVKNLRAFADNLDGAPPKKSGKVVDTDDAEETTDTEEAEEDFAKPAKTAAKGKKAAATFDADEDEEAEAEEDEESEEEADEETEEEEAPAPKKAAKPAKIDAKAVNEACKAHAKKHGFDTTKALLLKKFKTSTVSKLKPEQYADVVKAMKV